MGQNGQIAISHDLTYFTIKIVLRQYCVQVQWRFPPNKCIYHFINLKLGTAKYSKNNLQDNFWYLYK